jgi:hypothetical protein
MNEASDFKITQLTPEHLAQRHEEEKALFPGSLYGSYQDLTKGISSEFETALRAGPEEAIQCVLSAHPYLLQYAVANSGHHGIWVFPKRMIRTQKVDGTPGLIPDYLVVTCNSLGYSWHIIELKRRDTQFGSASGKSLSPAGTKAVTQCATYLTHFNQYIEAVRTNVGVPEISQPKTVIVLIGDATTEGAAQQTRRVEFCQLNPKMDIVTYDRLRRGLANDRGH